jgi:hypothetical protein
MGPNRALPGWRLSARSDGANTCLEARSDGERVSIRNSNDSSGPSLTVGATDWLSFLGHVTAGRVDHRVLNTPVISTPFVVSRTSNGDVAIALTTNPTQRCVRFTKQEWDVFVAGVTLDGEFSIEWLLLAPLAS